MHFLVGGMPTRNYLLGDSLVALSKNVNDFRLKIGFFQGILKILRRHVVRKFDKLEDMAMLLTMMVPKDILSELGLEEKEISLYLGLLELGEASVLTISKKTGVKRPTAYLILENLEKRGLVSRLVKGGKTFFAAQHPKKIQTETELRLSQLKEVMPQFEAMMKRADARPRVILYEGKDALDRAYDDSFIVKGEMLFMSNMDLVHDVFARTLQKFEYVSFSPEFKTRELADDSETTRTYARKVRGPYRQVRMMPKQFSPFNTDIGVFGNNTLITSGKKEYFTVRIESKEIADAFRAMFEAMWQISREVEDAPGVQK